MARNPKVDYTQYVHETENERGQKRYIVAEWNEAANQYQRPLTAQDAQLTGCHTETTRDLNWWLSSGFVDRRKALRRARYLFGTQDEYSE